MPSDGGGGGGDGGVRIAGREKSAVWEQTRDTGKCERDGKKGSKPGRMVREPEGHGGSNGEKRRHDGGEERATTWWGDARLGELETDGRTDDGVKRRQGKSWGSMDATPRGTTLSRILRSKPATA